MIATAEEIDGVDRTQSADLSSLPEPGNERRRGARIRALINVLMLGSIAFAPAADKAVRQYFTEPVARSASTPEHINGRSFVIGQEITIIAPGFEISDNPEYMTGTITGFLSNSNGEIIAVKIVGQNGQEDFINFDLIVQTDSTKIPKPLP